MSQSRYEYDENAQTWPYFVLTGSLVPLIPITISYISSNLFNSSEEAKDPNESLEKFFKPYNEKEIKDIKSKNKRSKVLTKTLLFIIIGWILVFYLIYKINTTEIKEIDNLFDPWKILGIDESFDDKAIRSVFRKLSLKFHPDKVDTTNMTQEQIDAVDAQYVLINKAYKALTDEVTKENFMKYGNPDGPAELKHGIAIPKFLIDGPTSPLLVIGYILCIGFLLPYFVGSWWSGVKSYTKQGLHVETAAWFLQLLINYNPAKLTTLETIFQYVCEAKEFESMSKELNSDKVYELLLAHVNRTPLNHKDEVLKLQVVSIAPKLILGLIDISSVFRNTEITIKAVEAHRSIVQALNPSGDAKLIKYSPILQLPGVSYDKLDKSEKIYTLGKLLKSSKDVQKSFLNITSDSELQNILNVATKIPKIEPISCEFKVPGESYVPPQSNSHISLKFFIKSPIHKSKPELKKLSKEVLETQLDEVETMETLRNPYKVVTDQPSLPIPFAPYFPDINYLKNSSGWIALLVVQRDGKLGEAPQYLTKVDLSNLELSEEQFINGEKVQVGTFKFPVTSPTPKELGKYQFRLILKNMVYFGSDVDIALVMKVEEEASDLEDEKDVYEIEDPDEDSIAGALATMRGEKVKKSPVYQESDGEDSDDDSDEEEDEEEEDDDWSDINTDTEVEEDALDKEN